MTKLILYHKTCFDGLGAAWAARQHPDWRDADIVPVAYDDPEPPAVDGCAVLIVDFSYPRDVLLGMKERAASLHVYDHHATAEAALLGLDFCTFDMARSGAGIVWDELIGGARPRAIDYIEDRDLWRHKLPFAAEVQAWMRSFPTTYETIELMVEELQLGPSLSVLAVGTAIVRFRRLIIETAAQDAQDVFIHGHRGRAVNFGTNEMYSEVAEEVGRGYAFGLAYRLAGDGKVYLSFRSDRDGGVDVGALAKSLGGGGHVHAAGAYVSTVMLLALLAGPPPSTSPESPE